MFAVSRYSVLDCKSHSGCFATIGMRFLHHKIVYGRFLSTFVDILQALCPWFGSVSMHIRWACNGSMGVAFLHLVRCPPILIRKCPVYSFPLGIAESLNVTQSLRLVAGITIALSLLISSAVSFWISSRWEGAEWQQSGRVVTLICVFTMQARCFGGVGGAWPSLPMGFPCPGWLCQIASDSYGQLGWQWLCSWPLKHVGVRSSGESDLSKKCFTWWQDSGRKLR